jgi:hypothetical protein
VLMIQVMNYCNAGGSSANIFLDEQKSSIMLSLYICLVYLLFQFILNVFAEL